MLKRKTIPIYLLIMLLFIAGCFNDETEAPKEEENEVENGTQLEENNDINEDVSGDGSWENPYIMEEGFIYEGDLLDYDFTINRSVNYRIPATPGEEYRVTLFNLATDANDDYWLTLKASDGPYVEDELANERIQSTDEEINLLITTDEDTLNLTIQTSLTDDSMEYAIMFEKAE